MSKLKIFLIIISIITFVIVLSYFLFSPEAIRENKRPAGAPLQEYFKPAPPLTGEPLAIIVPKKDFINFLLKLIRPAAVLIKETKITPPVFVSETDLTVIEAEDFSERTGLGEETNKLWAMYTDGNLAKEIYFPKSAAYAFTVSAYGNLADNIWPNLELIVDGQKKTDILIDDSQGKTFSTELAVAEGWRKIELKFNNDFYIPFLADRNLFIDRLRINIPSCFDGIQNQAEEKIDCGGPCQVCPQTADKKTLIYGTSVQSVFFTENYPEYLNYQSRLKELFSWGVMEDMGKMWQMHYQGRNQYYWKDIETTLDWFEANQMKLKYHTLVWDSQSLPGWYQQLSWLEKRQALEEHVRTIVKKYKDSQIAMYDVVNEPINKGTDDNYMGTGWEKIEAINKIFNWARQEDPEAILVINEYDAINRPTIRDQYINLINRLRAKGAPIDAIGLQGHFGWDDSKLPADEIITKALNEISSKTGLALYITEFDIKPPDNPNTPFEGYANWWDYQAWAYQRAYQIFSSQPAVKGVFCWGFYDRAIWQKGAGLFDESFNPKPVYDALAPILKTGK